MIRKLMQHGVIFGFAKATALLSPLLAASVLDQSSYGFFEWSLSLATIIAMVISLGAGNTIAFEKVKTIQSPLLYVAQNYSLYLGFLLALLSVCVLLILNDALIGLVMGMCAFFVMQYALSAYMKASGMGAWASFIDSGIYTVLLVLLLFASMQNRQDLPYLESFAVVAVFLGAGLFKTIETDNKLVFRDTMLMFIKRGFPIMIAGVTAALFFNLPKILLGMDSMAQVGAFALYFRWAAVALVVYQFITIVYFRDIYTKKYDDFDTFIGLVGLGVYAMGFLILFFIHTLEGLGMGNIPLPDENFLLQVLMIAIVALWAFNASLEGMLYRENKSFHQVFGNIIGIMCFLSAYFTLEQLGQDILFGIICSWFIGFIAMIVYQLYVIHKYILEKKFIYINRAVIVIAVVTCAFLEGSS